MAIVPTNPHNPKGLSPTTVRNLIAEIERLINQYNYHSNEMLYLQRKIRIAEGQLSRMEKANTNQLHIEDYKKECED